MVRKLVFICIAYFLSSSFSLAVKAPSQIPESFFKDLEQEFLKQKQQQDQAQGLPSNAAKPQTTPEQLTPPAPTNTQPQFIMPQGEAVKPQLGIAPQFQDQQNPASILEAANPCNEIPLYVEQILSEINNKNSTIISQLPPCFAHDRKLILRAVVLDPLQFQYADDSLLEDSIFVNRLLKISPQVLQFASPEIRGNEDFMENATYLSRDALQYAAWKLLDKKLFMKKMISIDSRNYKFASNRLKELAEFAEIAFEDNGLLLEFAPEKIKNDKKLVKLAILSNASAIEFASDELKKDKDLKKLAERKTSITSNADLEKFLRKNYITESDKKNLESFIDNKTKFHKKHQLVDRNYITKWQDYIDYSYTDANGRNFVKNTKLIAAASRNYHISWRDDFQEYKSAESKVAKFFLNHRLPSNVIENLSTTYLWKVKSKPLTLAFNLYLLRDSTDEDLGPDFVDVTSLTAILQKRDSRWEMTIVEVILDSEIKVDISHPSGHKKYILWDLYEVSEKDNNPKIIFKVEDGLDEYFEVFEEQSGGKYQMVYRSKNL